MKLNFLTIVLLYLSSIISLALKCQDIQSDTILKVNRVRYIEKTTTFIDIDIQLGHAPVGRYYTKSDEKQWFDKSGRLIQHDYQLPMYVRNKITYNSDGRIKSDVKLYSMIFAETPDSLKAKPAYTDTLTSYTYHYNIEGSKTNSSFVDNMSLKRGNTEYIYNQENKLISEIQYDMQKNISEYAIHKYNNKGYLSSSLISKGLYLKQLSYKYDYAGRLSEKTLTRDNFNSISRFNVETAKLKTTTIVSKERLESRSYRKYNESGLLSTIEEYTFDSELNKTLKRTVHYLYDASNLLQEIETYRPNTEKPENPILIHRIRYNYTFFEN